MSEPTDFDKLGRVCAQIALLKIAKRRIEDDFIDKAKAKRLVVIKRDIASITKTKMGLMAKCKAIIKSGESY